MKTLRFGLLTLLAVLGIATTAVPAPAYAQSAIDQIRKGVEVSGGNQGNNSVRLETRIRPIINVVLFVLGAIAVIMIIVSGFRYVLSGGDSSAVTAAKNTLFYAVIGLIVAILAYAIVNFVIDSLAK